MKVSTEIDNNFGYEKITQLVDNIPLRPTLLFRFTMYDVLNRSFYIFVNNVTLHLSI